MLKLTRSKSGRFVINLGLSFVPMAINYGISLYLTSYITRIFGTDAYGFVGLANNFAMYASILTVAVNSFAARYISVEYYNKEIEKAQRYYNTVFFADFIMGVILFSLSSIAVVFLDYFIRIPSEMLLDVKILFLLTMLNFLLQSCGTVFNVYSIIKNRIDILAIIKACSYLVEITVIVICYMIGRPLLFFVGIGLLSMSIVFLTLNFITNRILLPELHINKHFFSFDMCRDILNQGIWYSVNSLGNILNSGLDLWVTNIMLDGMIMGQIAIVKTVITICQALVQLVAQPFQPYQMEYFAKGEKESFIAINKLAIKVGGMFASVFLSGFILLGTAYYSLWTPNEDGAVLMKITMLSIIAVVVEGSASPLFYIYILTLKNKIPCIVTVVSGAINVISMMLLLNFTDLGAYAVVGTTTVLTLVFGGLFNFTYSALCSKCSISTYFIAFLRVLVSCTVLGGTACFIRKFVNITTWSGFIAYGMIYAIIASGTYWALCLDNEEKNKAKEVLIRKKR